MNKLRMVSLCSGIGGADLAAEWTGAIEIVGQVEINPFCQQVLAKHWPYVKRVFDIKEVIGDEFGAVDILVAGIPCQGNSFAGKRQGVEDERNLWPETRRIISAARPQWVVVENVLGLLSVDAGQLFGGILTDLDALGYRIGWSVYGAYEVGAPHQRNRVFLVAYSFSVGQRSRRSQCSRQQRTIQVARGNTSRTDMAYPGSDRCGDRANQQEQEAERERASDTGVYGSSQPVADSNCQRQQERDASTRGSESRLAARCVNTTMADPNSTRGALSVTRQHTTESFTECSTSGATQPCMGRDVDGLSRGLDAHKWPAKPGEKQEAWEPPRIIKEKQRYRNQRLKALGNAIVPQQIFPIFQAIVQWENEADDKARTRGRRDTQ